MATWILHFTRIDNRVVVGLNGSVVYDSSIIDNDPLLDISVPLEITPGGGNQLYVALYNTDTAPAPHPWDIAFTITDADGNQFADVAAAMPADAKPIISNDAAVYTTIFGFIG